MFSSGIVGALSGLFTDKVRGFLTVITLMAVLAFLVMNVFDKKEVTISEETVKTLTELTDQMKVTSDRLQTQTQISEGLNKNLIDNLKNLEHNRDKAYESLMDKYGMSPKNDNGINPGIGDTGGLQEWANSGRSQTLPGSPSIKNPDGYLQETISGKQESTYGGGTGTDRRSI